MIRYHHGIMFHPWRKDIQTNCDRPSIQTSAALISYNMKALLDQISSNKLLYQSAHVYPSRSFPGRTQENLLTQLLRKKLSPSDEDWIAEGNDFISNIANIAKNDSGSSEAIDTPIIKETLIQLWEWAGPAANNVAKEVLLSMSDSSDESNSQEDNDDEHENTKSGAQMEGIEIHPTNEPTKLGIASGIPLEQTFKFMCTGSS